MRLMLWKMNPEKTPRRTVMPEIMTPEELLEAIRRLPEDEILRVTFEEDSNGGEEV